MPFEKYKDLWELKEEHFHRIHPDKAVLIFLDCKDVTRNHRKYNLLERDPVYRFLSNAAYNVAMDTQLSCAIYAAVDEVSIIFPEVQWLMGYFRVGDCAGYILSLYMQRFLKHFWRDYPEIYLKGTLFQLPSKDIDRYLKYRQEVCKAVSMFYVAKENLPSEKYRGIPFDVDSIKELLLKEDLYQILYRHRDFFVGIRKNYTADETPRLWMELMR